MRKLAVLLCILVLSATNAQAKVCVLGETFNSADCLYGKTNDDKANFIDKCLGYTSEKPCTGAQTGTSCQKGGKTFYHCICKSGYEKLTGDKECLANKDDDCGCPVENIRCNSSIYKYTTKPENCYIYRTCSDNTGTYYSACDECDAIYTCTERGLIKPDNPNAKCTSSIDNVDRYNYCDCDTGWTSDPCNERNDGCTQPAGTDYRVDRGGGRGSCYLCRAEQCSGGGLNLDVYYCKTFNNTINTNCLSLGYSQTTCPSGTAVKCPFDPSYVFCM